MLVVGREEVLTKEVEHLFSGHNIVQQKDYDADYDYEN